MTVRYELCPELRVEPIGDCWCAFSPLSGETLLLNDEAAALLDVLSAGRATLNDICASLADDTHVSADDIHQRVAESWEQFLQAGLVLRTRVDRLS